MLETVIFTGYRLNNDDVLFPSSFLVLWIIILRKRQKISMRTKKKKGKFNKRQWKWHVLQVSTGGMSLWINKIVRRLPNWMYCDICNCTGKKNQDDVLDLDSSVVTTPKTLGEPSTSVSKQGCNNSHYLWSDSISIIGFRFRLFRFDYAKYCF